MDSLHKISFYLFLFFTPFTSAFAISGTINLPIISASILFALNIARFFANNKFNKNFIGLETISIVVLLIFVLFSFIINGVKYPFSLNHTLAYYSSFILFFLSPLFYLINYCTITDFNKNVLKYIVITVLVSAIFSLLEFSLTNIFSITVTDYIPRANVKDYDPFIVGFLIRSRGFAEESGHYGFMIEIFLPLCIYYMYSSEICTWKKAFKFFVVVCIILSIITSFSVASFLIIPTGVLFALLFNINATLHFIKNYYKRISVIILCLVVVWQLINIYIPINEIISITISEKFDSFSYVDRATRTEFFFKTFQNLPLTNIILGAGPSGFKILGYDDSFSFLSLYQTITFEVGLIGLLCLLFFLLSTFRKIYLIQNNFRTYLLISFYCGISHYTSILNYWYPWFWIMCAFAIFYYYKSPRTLYVQS